MSQRHTDTCTALGVALLADVPVILWGPPGQGKSSVVQELAQGMDAHLETVIASIREPSDFAGLPVVDPVTRTASLAAPSWAVRLRDAVLEQGRMGIQFYDEVSTAPPATQAALLRPILEGVVGDLRLPPGVRTVAAANPPDVAADGWDLAPPVANRFVHLSWELDADTVREGFTSGWPRVQVPTVDAAGGAGAAAADPGPGGGLPRLAPRTGHPAAALLRGGRARLPHPALVGDGRAPARPRHRRRCRQHRPDPAAGRDRRDRRRRDVPELPARAGPARPRDPPRRPRRARRRPPPHRPHLRRRGVGVGGDRGAQHPAAVGQLRSRPRPRRRGRQRRHRLLPRPPLGRRPTGRGAARRAHRPRPGRPSCASWTCSWARAERCPAPPPARPDRAPDRAPRPPGSSPSTRARRPCTTRPRCAWPPAAPGPPTSCPTSPTPSTR